MSPASPVSPQPRPETPWSARHREAAEQKRARRRQRRKELGW